MSPPRPHSSSEPCICKVCSCGKHKLCKPLWTCGPALNAHSEYCENYKAYMANVASKGKSAAPIQVPLAGGKFYGNTESKEQFIIHAIPTRVSAKKAEIVLQSGSLESVTTQKNDFKPFDVTKVVKTQSARPIQNYHSTKGQFDGTTTNRKDYLAYPLPPKFQRKAAEYVKTDAMLDSTSTQSDAYKKWDLSKIPKAMRRPETLPYYAANDSRDFKSTTAASYIGHNHKRVLAKKVYDIPVSEKFQATTTSQEAYQSWQIPAKYQTPKAIYVYSDTSMASKTEYKDTFKPKTTSKYVHVMPGYLPNAAKFEAQSTNKTDYARPENFVKTQDFSPRHKYIAIPDSRDFTTENRGRLDSKILPVCPASHWIQKERTIHPDGHIYLAPNQV